MVPLHPTATLFQYLDILPEDFVWLPAMEILHSLTPASGYQTVLPDLGLKEKDYFKTPIFNSYPAKIS